jgi:4-hydroxy-tetrahydrodipicolinate synthase
MTNQTTPSAPHVRFRGLSVALATPFDTDGRVDGEGVRAHARRMADAGVDVLMPCGTTGEGATLSPAEQREVLRLCLDEVGDRVHVVAGAGSNDTAATAALVRAARDEGAHGLLCVTPYYNKPSQEGLFRHFSALAEAGGGLPLVLYNVPGRTGVNLRPETVFRLAELEPVIAVKEASGDLDQIMTILRGRPEGFGVLSGDDAFALPVIALGGDGLVSVAANEVPESMSALVHAALAGRFEEARDIHFRLLPLLRANFVDVNPVPVKRALSLLGLMSDRVRLPLAPLSDAHESVLRHAMLEAGLELREEG